MEQNMWSGDDHKENVHIPLRDRLYIGTENVALPTLFEGLGHEATFAAKGTFTKKGSDLPGLLTDKPSRWMSSDEKAGPLKELLETAGVGALSKAFISHDISSIQEAAHLEIEEMQTILRQSGVCPTVGLVRYCRQVLVEAARGMELANWNATPESVLTRSMLPLKPEDLKTALNARLNAETIYAALMFGVAVAALVNIPATPVCQADLQNSVCDALNAGYLITWGIASACFSMATLVSLGAVQLFYGHATTGTIHRRFAKSEGYMVLSHCYISIGLMLGLLPGSCFNTFLRFPKHLWACSAVSVLHWLLWLHQFIRGIRAAHQVYKNFEGYSSIWSFLRGYVQMGNGSLQKKEFHKSSGRQRHTVCHAHGELNIGKFIS
jgi:hypothetical protein